MKFYLNISVDNFYTLNKKGQEAPVNPYVTATLLVAHSNLEHLRIYLSSGIYRLINTDELMHKTRQILSVVDDSRLLTYSYLKQVVNNLLLSDRCFEGAPKFDRGFVIFDNGVLDLKTKDFKPHSPHYFCISKVSFSYDPKAKCPTFISFLYSFCSGYDDRVFFLRAWLNALIFQRLNLQTFLVV